MFSLQNYRNGFDHILYAMVVYSLVFLYSVRNELFDLISKRKSSPDFYIGIMLIIFILWFYFSSKNKLLSIDKTKFSHADKEHIDKINDNLGHLKFGIISGGFAIIIGTLALIDKIIPGFFITLVMTYYADQNI